MTRLFKITFTVLLSLILVSGSVWAQPFTGEEKKTQINHKELPDGARSHIVENFTGAEILKAYKVFEGEKLLGYLVVIMQNEQEHSLYFGIDGVATKNKSK